MKFLAVGETWKNMVVVKDQEGKSKCEECVIKNTCMSTKGQPACLAEQRKDRTDIHFEHGTD